MDKNVQFWLKLAEVHDMAALWRTMTGDAAGAQERAAAADRCRQRAKLVQQDAEQ